MPVVIYVRSPRRSAGTITQQPNCLHGDTLEGDLVAVIEMPVILSVSGLSGIPVTVRAHLTSCPTRASGQQLLLQRCAPAFRRQQIRDRRAAIPPWPPAWLSPNRAGDIESSNRALREMSGKEASPKRTLRIGLNGFHEPLNEVIARQHKHHHKPVLHCGIRPGQATAPSPQEQWPSVLERRVCQ